MKRRLLLVIGAGFALVLLGTGFFVERELSERVTEEVDVALRVKAREIMALIEVEDGKITLDSKVRSIPEFARDEQPEYFQIWLDDGSPLYRSKGDEDLPRAASGETFDGTLPDGRAGRFVAIEFLPRSDDDDEKGAHKSAGTPPGVVAKKTIDGPVEERRLFLVVAQGRERLDAFIARMRMTMLGMGGLATLLGALFIWRALAAGFRPVDQIVAQVETLDAERLTRRVRLARTPRELAPIVEQLNALLERLAASFQRERRFTANVAHELRTPIAELRSLAEVGGKWPDDRTSVERFFGDVGEIAGRMEAVITDLLLLARCQAGVEKAKLSPVLLRGAVATAWQRTAKKRAANLALDVADDLVVESDPGKLAIILTNVLGNAASYARAGTEIRCTAARRDGRFELEIANEAEPLDSDDLARLAEPFWRKDEARSADDHAGLGLSVVTALATLIGHECAFAQDQNGTFRVRLGGSAAACDALPA